MAKAKSSFSTILNDVPTPVQVNSTTPTEPEKGPLVTFFIDKDLKPILDRVVSWRGKGGSQRQVINEALRLLFESDPNASRPFPGE